MMNITDAMASTSPMLLPSDVAPIIGLRPAVDTGHSPEQSGCAGISGPHRWTPHQNPPHTVPSVFGIFGERKGGRKQ